MNALEQMRARADRFNEAIKNGQWKVAYITYFEAIEHCLELTESERDTVFGIRGDKGTTILQGWFDEEKVIEVGDMVMFGRPVYAIQRKKDEARKRMEVSNRHKESPGART